MLVCCWLAVTAFPINLLESEMWSAKMFVLRHGQAEPDGPQHSQSTQLTMQAARRLATVAAHRRGALVAARRPLSAAAAAAAELPCEKMTMFAAINDALRVVDKQARALWCAEATALGYEAGTIKNSAYVLLAASGATGMTVAAIVDAATKQG